MRDLVHELKKQKALKLHEHKIWQGKNGCWYTYIVVNESRKLIKRTSEKAIHDRILAYYESGENSDSPDSHLFGNFYEKWLANQQGYGLDPNTLKRYENDYKRFCARRSIESMCVSEITPDFLMKYMVEIVQELKLRDKASRSCFGLIARVLKYAVSIGEISINPADSVDHRVYMRFAEHPVQISDDRIFSDDEMRKLLEEIRLDHERIPDYIPSFAVELATCTGMRVGELAGLRWSNVMYGDGVIVVDSSEKYNQETREFYVSKTKNRKSRVIPMTEKMREILRTVQKVEMRNGWYGEYVFQNSQGRVHKSQISSCIQTKCKQAGIPDKSIHAIRRTVNSKMKMRGVPTTVAAMLLGHSEEVNERCYTYDIGDIDRKRNAIECGQYDYRDDYHGNVFTENAVK